MLSGVTTAEIFDYVSAAISLVILITRLFLEYRRQHRFDLNFYLASASISTVVARLVVTYYYIKLGATGGGSPIESGTQDINPYDAKVGEILVLVARVLFTAILWLQVCLILSFYARLVHGVTVMTWVLRAIWLAVISTFTTVVLVTFLECRPFERYWERTPEPDTCTRAYAQLLVQTISNVVLDVVVLIIAFPLTRLSKHSWSKRLRVYLLVGMGLICIGITIARTVEIFKTPNQSVRSIWASVQITVAIFVGNAPSIYGSAKILKRRTATDRSYDIADSNDTNYLPPLVARSALPDLETDTTPRDMS